MYLRFFNNLKGKWSLHRVVSNRKATDCSVDKIEGFAYFKALGSKETYYREEGTLTTAKGDSYQFDREYVYCLDESNKSIGKYYARDAKRTDFFHSLKFEEKEELAKGEHLCEKDIYKATYRFSDKDPDKLEINYDVQGPSKDQLITTSLKRFS